MKDIDFDLILREGRGIRIHPNGFIQIDLPDHCRMHVWSDLVPPQNNGASHIHDHIFSFHSIILRGSLTNTLYRIYDSPKGEYNLFEATKINREDTQLVAPDVNRRISIKPYKRIHCEVGDGYTNYVRDFHQVEATHNTITVIKMGPIDPFCKARVLVPISVTLDDNHTRYSIEPTKLWEIVEQVFNAPVI